MGNNLVNDSQAEYNAYKTKYNIYDTVWNAQIATKHEVITFGTSAPTG